MSSPINTGTSVPGSQNETKSHKSSVGPIVGGVICGLAALALIAIAFFFLLRRHRTVPEAPAQYNTREAELWSGSSVNQSRHLSGSQPPTNPRGTPFPPSSSQQFAFLMKKILITDLPSMSLRWNQRSLQRTVPHRAIFNWISHRPLIARNCA